MNTVEQLKRYIPNLLRAFPAVELLYLYGSQASNRATSASDIDIAVLLEEGVCRQDPLLDLKISLYLEDVLGRSVDVVILNKVSPILQHEVVRTGTRLYACSPQRRRMYELRSFKSYVDVRHYQHRRQRGAICG